MIDHLHISDEQLWKLVGDKPYQQLVNKAGLWKSPDNWKFHDDEAIRTIEDLVRNQVLGVQKEEVRGLVALEAGEIWEREKFNDTHFILQVLSGFQALTENLAGDFIEGNFYQFNETVCNENCPIYTQTRKYLVHNSKFKA